MMMTLPIGDLAPVHTKRLTLRPLIIEEADRLQVLTDDPVITEAIDFLTTPFALADAETLIRRNNADNCFLGVWQGTDLIGVVGVHAVGSDQLEIGYWIGSRLHRKGYASEAATGLIERLAEVHPDKAIIAECKLANQASWQLLHKMGFKQIGMQGKRAGRELLTLSCDE